MRTSTLGDIPRPYEINPNKNNTFKHGRSLDDLACYTEDDNGEVLVACLCGALKERIPVERVGFEAPLCSEHSYTRSANGTRKSTKPPRLKVA